MNVWNWENDRKDVAWKRTLKKNPFLPLIFIFWAGFERLAKLRYRHKLVQATFSVCPWQTEKPNQTKPNQLHEQGNQWCAAEFFQQSLSKFFPQSWISSLRFIFQRKRPENNMAHELWSEAMWFPSSSVATPLGWDFKLLCCFFSPKIPGGNSPNLCICLCRMSLFHTRHLFIIHVQADAHLEEQSKAFCMSNSLF